MKYTIAIALLFLSTTTARAEIAITIYNQDLALVRESREFDFPKGVGELRFVDVAARIIPTSVHFSSESAALLEQNYEYDLVSSDKLLSKYLDRQVTIAMEDGSVVLGKLLSTTGDVVLEQQDGGIRSLARDRVVDVSFPDLPEGLITRPTLVWLVESPKGGKGRGEVSYLTNGVSWEAEYVAVTDQDDKSLSMTGWVNINNKSGATYKDAQIKLMAGDVQILEEPRWKGRGSRDMMVADAMAMGTPQFEEQAFYEYHLYTLQRPSTLRDNQVKQISLFPTANVKKVEKEYRFDASQQRYGKKADDVKVTLIYDNSEANGLGIPLPKGKVRVYKQGPDGGLEFIGEDRIDHTPRNEKVRISTGNAFDIVGERTQTDVDRQGKQRTIEIKIRNRKVGETVEVVVAEHLYGDWTILSADPANWEKKSADLVEWKLTVKPDEERKITYTVLNH